MITLLIIIVLALLAVVLIGLLTAGIGFVFAFWPIILLVLVFVILDFMVARAIVRKIKSMKKESK